MPDQGVDKVTDKSIDKSTDKSRQSNSFVKQKMYAALLRLLRSKAFSAISVSDLTSEAQVSRMSFYRNFNSIEDILTEHLDELIVEYQREDEKIDAAGLENIYYGKEYMVHSFQFLYKHHQFFDILISCGMGDLFLSKITEYMLWKWVIPEHNTRKDSLLVSAFAGSVYNMYREWRKADYKDSPEDIAAIFYHTGKRTKLS